MFKNYNTNQVVLPLDFTLVIPENDIARLIDSFIESIPDSEFEAFKHDRGASSFHPRMMLKLLLCAYAQSITSGRKIEGLMKDSIRMMWLAQGHEPSYRTINRFRVDSRVLPLIQTCFVQLRSHLVETNQITEEAIFIDGTKIEAAANKYTFVWKTAIEKNHKNLEKKSLEAYQTLVEQEIIPTLERESDGELSKEEIHALTTRLTETVEQYDEAIEQEPIGSVRKQLRSKRKMPKVQLKHFRSHQERVQKYEHQYRILGDRKSYSKTDTDATFMRMKEDHMRNGQLKAGYNLQIATNNRYVLGYDLFANPTDTRTLQPFLETLQAQFLPLPPYIVADAGYGSESNYRFFEDELPQQTPLIPYSTMIKEQSKKWQTDEKKVMNWDYFETDDYYVDPKGVRFNFNTYRTETDDYGFEREFKEYVAETKDANQKKLPEAFTPGGYRRKIKVNPSLEYFKAQQRDLLSAPETSANYAQRKIDVESTFGHLKACLKWTRFSVRGKDKVKNEVGIALMAVNMKKMMLNRQHESNTGKSSYKKTGIKIEKAILIPVFS